MEKEYQKKETFWHGCKPRIIDKSGSWFSYNGERIGQGRENAKRYLVDRPELLAEVEKKVRDNFAKAFEQSLGEELPEDKEETEEPEE